MKKIIIAGGTGFIGEYLKNEYTKEGHKVIIISRQNNHLNWTDSKGIQLALENSDLLINLAGKSVDCRYTAKNKAEIFRSRISTTQLLGEAVKQCFNPPPLWINSSTATIYRHEEAHANTESEGIIGHGFSVDVAQQWEQTFFKFELPQTRQVALRIAIVLGNTGGALKPLKNLVKYGLGGPQGNGKQMFSWLHIEDLKNIIDFVVNNATLNGAINCASPNAINNKELMHSLRQCIGVPIGLPAPKGLLKMGAMLIKTETELILKSRWVYPEILLQNGFNFKYPTLVSALNDLN